MFLGISHFNFGQSYLFAFFQWIFLPCLVVGLRTFVGSHFSGGRNSVSAIITYTYNPSESTQQNLHSMSKMGNQIRTHLIHFWLCLKVNYQFLLLNLHFSKTLTGDTIRTCKHDTSLKYVVTKVFNINILFMMRLLLNFYYLIKFFDHNIKYSFVDSCIFFQKLSYKQNRNSQ